MPFVVVIPGIYFSLFVVFFHPHDVQDLMISRVRCYCNYVSLHQNLG